MEVMLRDYVRVEKIPANCGNCPNYGRCWSCPPYERDPEEIWRSYRKIEILAEKIVPNADAPDVSTLEGCRELLWPFRDAIDAELARRERAVPGSLRLNAGKCHLCETCTRPGGEPCRHPEEMRYSIESLGGIVSGIAADVLHTPLRWAKDGALPEYFLLVGALLVP